VYGLSQRPHTIPRSLSPTRRMMKNCLFTPTPNPNQTPTRSLAVSGCFHAPG
jgi:hypothetical protein